MGLFLRVAGKLLDWYAVDNGDGTATPTVNLGVESIDIGKVDQGNAGTSAQSWFTKLVDTAGTIVATLKAASTPSAATDTALVVDIRPGGLVPAQGPAVKASSSPVTFATDDPNATNIGTILHTTTPSKSNANTGPIEVSKVGSAYMESSIRHQRQLSIATGVGAFASFGSLTEGACQGVFVDTDSLVIYGQPPERSSILIQTAVGWGSGSPPAGWTFVGTVATHSNGGGTTALTQDTATTHAADPVLNAKTYVVVYTVTGRTQGTVTPQIGSNNGTAVSTNNTFIDVITGNGTTVNFVPTNTFDGSIDVSSVWVFAGSPPIRSIDTIPFSFVKIVAVALSTTPATLSSTANIWGLWLRRPGAVEIT